MDVNPIQKWPGDLLPVAFDIPDCAPASLLGIGEVPAGTRVHRRDQHEICGEGRGGAGSRDVYHAVFQRLPENLKGASRELGEFIQEQNPVVGQADLARTRNSASTY